MFCIYNMYNLSHFKETDTQRVMEFMRAHPFVMLCGAFLNGRPVATQVPVLFREVDGRLFLRGHFMRKNDHHLAFAENPDALVVFTGPHEYVNASWYSNPVQASTWNYLAVHARGTMKFVSEESLMKILEETTDHFENNSHSPALFKNLPTEYVQRLIKAIIGFEIEVNEIDNVFKLSQNRDKESYHNIMQKLHERGSDGAAIAEEMGKRIDEVFGRES